MTVVGRELVKTTDFPNLAALLLLVGSGKIQTVGEMPAR